MQFLDLLPRIGLTNQQQSLERQRGPIQQTHAVAQRLYVRQHVCREEDGAACGTLVLQLRLNQNACFGVHTTQWFIQNQQFTPS